jgi:hypothetical protein
MMLVDTAYRGRGIGRQLLRHALAQLDNHQVATVRLDATQQGSPLYEQHGFRKQSQVLRYAGNVGVVRPSPAASQLERRDLPDISRLDQYATCTDRRPLLAMLLTLRGMQAFGLRGANGLEAFALSRPGRVARQIGPCAATAADLGLAIFEHTLEWHTGQSVFVDIPQANQQAQQIARNAGLCVQRHFMRMCRGPLLEEQPDVFWISSGPELG